MGADQKRDYPKRWIAGIAEDDNEGWLTTEDTEDHAGKDGDLAPLEFEFTVSGC